MSRTSVSHTAWSQAFAWILLGTMLASVAGPLLSATEAPETSAYADWLMDRGANEVPAKLSDALRVAAQGGHRSLESFVREFAREVAETGALSAAGAAFQAQTGSTAITESELVEVILADLRALSPNEAEQSARLSNSESSALIAGSRVVFDSRNSDSTPLPVSAAAPVVAERLIAMGLTTSIQSLGP